GARRLGWWAGWPAGQGTGSGAVRAYASGSGLGAAVPRTGPLAAHRRLEAGAAAPGGQGWRAGVPALVTGRRGPGDPGAARTPPGGRCPRCPAVAGPAAVSAAAGLFAAAVSPGPSPPRG